MKKGKTERRKNIVIAAGVLCILAVGMIAAYFTGTDEASNEFTVGSVNIELEEENWSSQTDVTPNKVMKKDPVVKNTGDNSAFVFLKVTVPKKEIKTSALADGKASSSAVTQELFQINSSENKDAVWKGENVNGKFNTYNTGWKVFKSETTGADADVYYLAYVNDASAATPTCKALAKDGSTPAAFDSVTFVNALAGQNLEGTTQDLDVEAFAIQTDDLAGHGDNSKTSPSDVWSILSNQIG